MTPQEVLIKRMDDLSLQMLLTSKELVAHGHLLTEHSLPWADLLESDAHLLIAWTKSMRQQRQVRQQTEDAALDHA
jgi:hypothetical protein